MNAALIRPFVERAMKSLEEMNSDLTPQGVLSKVDSVVVSMKNIKSIAQDEMKQMIEDVGRDF